MLNTITFERRETSENINNASEVPGEKIKKKNKIKEYSLCHIVLPILVGGHGLIWLLHKHGHTDVWCLS
jgi:hypothetical protein